ncbi:sodium:proton antiporter [Thermogladius sp. 4427co]|uniref:sodium:proton antiporter n=1 Tax=Thermogladius sp. 4427co TaxID=3450718 RepID=UPI003F7ABBA5
MDRLMYLGISEAAIYSALAMILVFTVFYLLYLAVRNKSVRYTEMYLSAEGEDVVSNPTPSVGGLYWGFVKSYARRLYKILAERVQTGSLVDWFYFISSWLGLLIILSVVLGIIYVFVRW